MAASSEQPAQPVVSNQRARVFRHAVGRVAAEDAREARRVAERRRLGRLVEPVAGRAVADTPNSLGAAALKFADALGTEPIPFDVILYKVEVDIPTLKAANATVKKALGEVVDGGDDAAAARPLKRSRTL